MTPFFFNPGNSYIAFARRGWLLKTQRIHLTGRISNSHIMFRQLPDIMRSNKYPLGSLSQGKIHKSVQADFSTHSILKNVQLIQTVL